MILKPIACLVYLTYSLSCFGRDVSYKYDFGDGSMFAIKPLNHYLHFHKIDLFGLCFSPFLLIFNIPPMFDIDAVADPPVRSGIILLHVSTPKSKNGLRSFMPKDLFNPPIIVFVSLLCLYLMFVFFLLSGG